MTLKAIGSCGVGGMETGRKVGVGFGVNVGGMAVGVSVGGGAEVGEATGVGATALSLA